jgi:lipoyl(octanoyl) transferase
MSINVVVLGNINYNEALEIQTKLVTLRKLGQIDDTLLLLEHPPVLTMGKRADARNILVSQQLLETYGAEIHQINRGGDVTYHGPGQIVGYPIMDLVKNGPSIKNFVWKLEQVFIQMLKAEYNITAYSEEKKYTGVWINNKKITAIGIAVNPGYITMHGFAFNVNTQLDHFSWINPCGILDKGVTSLQKVLGHPLDLAKVNEQVLQYFSAMFDIKPKKMNKTELYRIIKGVGETANAKKT